MDLKKGFRAVKSALFAFADDNAMTLGAALAFYAALSTAPLLLILIAVTSLLAPDVQSRVVQQIENTVGAKAGNAIQDIIQSGAAQRRVGTISAIVGLIILVFSATGAFVQAQYSLNTIWGVQPKPGSSVWRWVWKRILSLGMILGIGLLLLVSMVLSTVINVLFAGTGGYVWQVADFFGALIVYILLFALIYKVLPDVEISWQDVWVGATITAVLFAVGKFLIGFYLGRGGVASAYGAAGSLVALLLWIYYSALIFFLGAEMTQAYARVYGKRLRPPRGAEHGT
jgi:membrane protein